MASRKEKGTFAAIRLAVAGKYVYPFSRKRMMVIGGTACVAVLLLFLFNAFFGRNSLFSEGPLSVNHANFEPECARCHESFKMVSDRKCSLCHEKANDRLGIYTFAAHYLYRSADQRRVKASQTKYAGEEIPCASCHPEHNGRDAGITHVPDSKCIRCHGYGSFNRDHPQFEFARNQIPDDSSLIFTHIRHTKEVLGKLETVNLETACLYCHNAEPDGKNFKPTSFDLHCAGCHQPVALETPQLTLRDPNNPVVPGVETLDMLRKRGAPGTMWAFYTNPNEFTVKPNGRVVKSPVFHQDPWIIENLTLIRRTLYADLGLSELVKSMGGVPPNRTGRLYKEALQTLKGYLDGLRGRTEPEIQAEVAHLDTLVRLAQTKIGNGQGILSDSAFGGKLIENPDLTTAQRNSLEEFARRVASPCLKCHMVEHASIVRVNSDQRVLTRAVFNHRAHILQKRCLECHTEVPIQQTVVGKDTSAALRLKDRSSVQNIPRIENCYQCHNRKEASNRCVTCHEMHPREENRSNLQLFVGSN